MSHGQKWTNEKQNAADETDALASEPTQRQIDLEKEEKELEEKWRILELKQQALEEKELVLNLRTQASKLGFDRETVLNEDPSTLEQNVLDALHGRDGMSEQDGADRCEAMFDEAITSMNRTIQDLTNLVGGVQSGEDSQATSIEMSKSNGTIIELDIVRSSESDNQNTNVEDWCHRVRTVWNLIFGFEGVRIGENLKQKLVVLIREGNALVEEGRKRKRRWQALKLRYGTQIAEEQRKRLAWVEQIVLKAIRELPVPGTGRPNEQAVNSKDRDPVLTKGQCRCTGIIPLSNYQVVIYQSIGASAVLSLVLTGTVSMFSELTLGFWVDKIGRRGALVCLIERHWLRPAVTSRTSFSGMQS